MKKNKVYNIDFLNNELEDKSVQLLIVDPPYFEVKGEFDFIWKSFDDYLKDVEKWAKECKRILADNGTLFWWGTEKKLPYTQIILDKYFYLENSLVWEKPSSANEWDTRRSFPTRAIERVLMYHNEYESEEWNKTGLERIMEEHIKPRHPFALYMREELQRAGVSRKEIAKLFPSKNGNLTGCVSNWLNGDNTPTKEQYLKIRKFLNGEYLRKEYEYLRKEYEELRKEYEELRKEYEELRRPFNNIHNLTDVIRMSNDSVQNGYNHPTKKPLKLTRMLIQTCSRKGDLVVVPFAGSGTECEASVLEGREVIGFDIEAKYCKMTQGRIDKELNNPRLFY